MFSRLQRFYTSIKIATDIFMLAVAFGLAYATRFIGVIPVTEGIPPLDETLASLGMALIIFPITFHQANLYTTNRSRTHIGELFAVFKASITATLILVALTYFTRERYSRFTLALFLGYALVLVSITRLLLRIALAEVRRRGFNVKTILVIGEGELGRRVVETVRDHRELGFRVIGVLAQDLEKARRKVRGAPVIGNLEDVERVLDEQPVDQVIIALPLEQQLVVKDLMERLALRTVDVKVVPDLYQYITLYGGLEEFGGLPIISLQGDPMDGWSRVAKRVFDILFSLVAIALTAPVMLVTALMVKLTSRGPIFYRQERMGWTGATFHMLKFRSMRVDAERPRAPSWASAERCPPHAARHASCASYSLDELPQFFNVLVGDMSLVGPRPERPVFIEQFRRQIPSYMLRHQVKAGITGWAQVNGWRGNTSLRSRVEYDLYYISNWSLWLDLKILVRTALGGFLSKNAY